MTITFDKASNLSSFKTLSPEENGASDFSNLLKQQKSAGDVGQIENISSLNDAKQQLCKNIYAEVSQIVSGVVWPLLALDPEILRSYTSQPENRVIIEDSLDHVEVLLDTLLNQCADFLDPDQLARVRNMKGDLESLREAMQIGTGESIRAALSAFLEGFSSLMSRAAQFTLPLIRKALPGGSPEFQ